MAGTLRTTQRFSLCLVGASFVVALAGPSDLSRPDELSRTRLEGVRGASKYKKVLGKSNCDEANAGYIAVNGGPPGVPKGTYVTNCSGNTGAQCVYCSLTSTAGSENVTTDASKGDPGALGMDVTTNTVSCGDLYSGHCNEVNGVLQCVDDNGTPEGDCGDIHTTIYQAEDPGLPGD